MSDKEKPKFEPGQTVYCARLPGQEFTVVCENPDGTYDLSLAEYWYYIRPEEIFKPEDQDD